jgi:hypothetical protein
MFTNQQSSLTMEELKENKIKSFELTEKKMPN